MDTNALTKTMFIGSGKSSIVYEIDGNRVLKEFFEDGEDIDTERRVFARLGSHHPQIVQYLGDASPTSIILELGLPLSKIQRQVRFTSIPFARRLSWMKQAAEGLWHMHAMGVVHADVGSENLILVNGCVKIIDFEGCSIDGSEASSGYKWYSCLDIGSPNVKSDIFAFGCLVYQLVTGQYPHGDLEREKDRHIQCRNRFRQGIFPDVRGRVFEELMLGCWRGIFDSMGEIITRLEDGELAMRRLDGLRCLQ